MTFLRILLVSSLLATSAASTPARAEDGLRLAEAAIKAGLVYNFLHYTRWPEDLSRTGQPIRVCVCGADPFQGRLDPIARRTVNQRSIRLQSLQAPRESAACDLLIVGDAARWPQFRAALADRAVLTVGDFPGFAEAGGMIEFTRERDHVGMRVNVSALSRAGLHVENRLLVLADTTGARRR